MIAKIIMPVINTENGKFEYKGKELSREEFGRMEYEQFLRTDRDISRFADNLKNGISNYDSGYSSRLRDYREIKNPEILYNAEEEEAILYNSKRIEVDSSYFEQYVENGKMFIAVLNFNPDKMSGDAKSEMLYWMQDSRLTLEDNSITEDLKLKTLPPRHFWVEDGDKHILFMGCKIVQIFSDKRNPFYIGIIVEKAKYDDGK